MSPTVAKAPAPRSASSERSVSKPDLTPIVLLLVLGAFQVATVQTVESFGSDSSVYMVLAHNILEKGRYEFDYRPHTVYPPGFPLLLAGVSILTGREGYNLFIRLMPVFSTFALMVWYFVLRRDAGRVAAGSACLLVATSAPLFQMVTRSVLSDAPFFLMSGLAFWSLQGLEEPASQRRSVRYLLLASVCLCTVMTVLVRSAGVALSAALFAWAVTGKLCRADRSALYRAAVLASLAGFLVFGWWTVWTKHAEHRVYQGQYMESYASQFMAKNPHRPEMGTASAVDLVIRAGSNILVQASYLAALATRASYVMPTWYSPLTVVTIVLLLWGLVSSGLNRQKTLPAWYFLAYFAIYLLWPFDEGPRFMLPVAPLAFVLVWRGVLKVTDLLRRRPTSTLAAVSVLGIALAGGTGVTGRLPGRQAHAALLLWPLLGAASAALMFLAKRAGQGAATRAFDLVVVPFRSWRAHYGIVGLLLLGGIVQQAESARTNLAENPSHFRHYASADFSAWLRTAPQGAVMAHQFAIVHRLTGRRVVEFPITSDPNLIVTVVKREKVLYLFVNDPVPYEYFLPTEEERWRRIERAYPVMFQLVHRGPGYRVFEVREPGPTTTE